MADKGDNNKHGSAVTGAAKQSNQAFITNGQEHMKSNLRTQSGGKQSAPQPNKQDAAASREGQRKRAERTEIW